MSTGPVFDPTSPVFFMIGSQRSGSNWLQSMLNEREDLAGPHPPHIMRDIMPKIAKFGDIVNDRAQRRVLVDHVCTFVERNQVAWTDKHDVLIQFDRDQLLDEAEYKLQNISSTFLLEDDASVQSDETDDVTLTEAHVLLSIVDGIYSKHAILNDKRTWICKSMGMSKFHDVLLDYYGKERLRYVYLYRDPRDVAMSFMNTPVGDCHLYAIVKKWTALQRAALRIVEEMPELVHQLNYEALLTVREVCVEELYEFIGARRFGWVNRKGSVLCMKDVMECVDDAKDSTETAKRAELSYQFKNLVRGASFAKEQLQKWRYGKTPLTVDELRIIESEAHEIMDVLGYQTHVIHCPELPREWTEDDIAEFTRLNEDGIKQMNANLEKENPGDMARRKFQKAVLQFEAELIAMPLSQGWHGPDPRVVRVAQKRGGALPPPLEKWPEGADFVGYLSEAEVAARTVTQSGESLALPGGFTMTWAAVSQSGYYPDSKNKPNQDRFVVKTLSNGAHIFGVFDGHGPVGHDCAELVCSRFPALLEQVLEQTGGVGEALSTALTTANTELEAATEIDHKLSGSTANVIYFGEDEVLVANIGDSRAIAGRNDGKGLTAHALSEDHTLFREDEANRIQAQGGRVLTSAQLDDPGLDGAPEDLRVWALDGKYPGTAFTRSLGDGVAKSLGVSADCEIQRTKVSAIDRLYLVCSDGITDFIPPQIVVERASNYDNAHDACRALVGEAYKYWIASEDRSDDLTVAIAFVHPPCAP